MVKVTKTNLKNKQKNAAVYMQLLCEANMYLLEKIKTTLLYVHLKLKLAPAAAQFSAE